MWTPHHHQLDTTNSWTERSFQKRPKIEILRATPRSSSKETNESSATVDPQNRVSDLSRSHQEQEGSRRQDPQQQKERKLLLKGNRVNHRRLKSTSLLIEMKTMKNLEMSLEPLQRLNLLYQHFLKNLVMKTVSTAMNAVHKVKTLEEQYSIPISMYWQMKSIG